MTGNTSHTLEASTITGRGSDTEPSGSPSSRPASSDQLTRQQEAFCQALKATGMSAQAYRIAFPESAGVGARAIGVRAWKLRQRPRVARRLAQLGVKLDNEARWPRTFEMKPAHEIFCGAFVETGNAAEAYRRAFPDRCNGDMAKAGRRGWALKQTPEIADRIRELTDIAMQAVREAQPRSQVSEVCDRSTTWLAVGDAEAQRGVARPAGHLLPTGGTDAADVLALERMAAVAFDDGQPDVARLAALRILTAGLMARGRHARHGDPVSVTATITVNIALTCSCRARDAGPS